MPSTDDEFSITIEGQAYTLDDLSFKEQREVRTTVRELMGDPEGDVGDAAMMDFIPALAFVIVKRDKPAFTLDEALDLKMPDLLKSDEPEVPPTRARAKPKA